MKKILKISIVFVVILTNFYFIHIINQQRAIQFLQGDRETVQIAFDDMENPTVREEIIEPLIAFSNEYQISILQFNHIDAETMNIYAINLAYDNQVRLDTGILPHGDYFISNRDYHSAYQSGTLTFPISNWDIRIYDFNRIGDFGVNDFFHLSQPTDEILSAFIDEFSSFGEITVGVIDWSQAMLSGVEVTEDLTLVETNFLQDVLQIHSPLFLGVILSYSLLLLGIIFYVSQSRKELLLKDLWGYGTMEILLSVPKSLLRFYVGMFIVMGAILTGSIIYFRQQYFFLTYTGIFLSVAVAVGISVFLFTFLAVLLVRKLNDLSVNIRGKAYFQKAQRISIGGKVVVYVGFCLVIITTVANVRMVRTELDNFSFWEQAQDVFRIRLNTPDATGEWVSAEWDDALGDFEELDDEQRELWESGAMRYYLPGTFREFHNKLNYFYGRLTNEKNGFIINSNRFNREEIELALEMIKLNHGERIPPWLNERIVEYREEWGEYLPQYLWNVFDEADVYSANNGRMITIDENFLNIHPIYDLEGTLVSEKIIHNPNVLNILVPESARRFEEQIIEDYREFFYSSAIYWENIDNAALGLPLRTETIDDLTINIIYVENNQPYFTFNSHAGNNQNQVIDPVAVIHTNNLGSEFIDNMKFTQSMFFFDEARDNRVESIQQFMDDAGISGYPIISSVFNEANQDLIQVQWELFQQMLLLVIVSILVLIIAIIFIWTYYQLNVYELNLRYLFGYSYWSRNETIIVTTILANTFAGAVGFFFMRSIEVVLLMVLLTGLDLLAIYLLENYLTRKNINKVLKGGEL